MPTRSRGLWPPRARVVGAAAAADKSRAPPWSVIPTERRVESFADDLNTRRGIVSGRVALLPRSIPPISFLAPYGFSSPLTRTHVRLLGPCFKTGRMGSPQADARSTQVPKHAEAARAESHDRSTSSRQSEQTPGANRAKESKRKKGHVFCRRTVRGVDASVMLFSCRKIYRTTLGNGYLGSRIDEERSEMRYLV